MTFLKHLFIPHKDNNFQSHLIRPSAILFYIGVLIALQAGFGLVNIVKPGILGIKSTITVSEIIDLTNKERIKRGIPPLKNNETLSAAALRKGRDMMAKNYWAHNAPDGHDPWYFINQAGYSYSFAGENLARNFSDSTSVLTAWLASSTHRDNLLDERYQEIGVAVLEGFYGNYDTTLVVQMFGTPTVTTAALPTPAQATSLKETVFPNPAPVPTAAPFETSKVIPTQPTFLPEVEVRAVTRELPPRNLINPFTATRNFSLSLAIFVLALLSIDAVWVTQKKITRISGHGNVAHSAFFIVLILALWLTTAGQIL